jgi:RNA-binding protein NOB1
MGLNLVSIKGFRIKRISQWVKRCSCCGAIEPDVKRIFCPKCGNNTLLRVSCSSDENGDVKFFFNAKKKINLRGTKFGIPIPKGGRHEVRPILREDQLKSFKDGKPKKNSNNLKKRVQNKDDIWESGFSFEIGINNNKKINRNKNHKPTTFMNGYDRKNPNEVKKKYKK